MGTENFFKHNQPHIGPGSGPGSGMNLEARAIGAGNYAGAKAGGNAQKDIAAAKALYAKHGFKPQERSAAYPKGSKI